MFHVRHAPHWLCVLFGVILMTIIAILMTPPVAGQTALTTPTVTPTPTPAVVYLPVIQHQPDPCAAADLPTPLPETPLADEIVTAGQVVTFTWQFSDDCPTTQPHYTLQIADTIEFDPDSILHGVGVWADGLDDSGEPYEETSYSLTAPQPGTYYWRVAAFDDSRSSAWSDPRQITVEADTPQLLENPSFEASLDTINPWQWLDPDGTSYQVRDDDLTARHGQHYLAVNRQDGTHGKKSFYQDIDGPQPGQTYHFAIWVRADTAAVEAGRPRTGRVDLWAFDGVASREHSTHNFQVTDTAWHCVETSLTVQQSGHARLRAEVYLTALDGFDTFFDQAVLRDDGQPTCSPISNSNGATLTSTGQGFDTCAAPTLVELAAWRQASPYDYIGIYVGGANHYAPCKSYNQQYQTAAWFETAAEQGWQFLPTWVGPQAPCTAFNVLHSSDPNIAWSEGIAEAQQALQAAATLGLITAAKPGTIIYYDMEYYPPDDVDCHQAVNAFLAGWVSELQNQGYQAGIYGSVHAVNDWYTLEHVPDSVWVASYVRTDYDPTITVDVVNQAWITESYWSQNRLFQYSNSHTENWGGVTLNIDNDVAAGLVALGKTPATPPQRLHDVQLLTPTQGWGWVGAQLFWTDTGGHDWQEITPPTTRPLQAISFADDAHGWAITRQDEARLSLWRTEDGGQTWQVLPDSLAVDLPPGEMTLHFNDSQTGWLLIEQATGLNFSRGRLFRTTDGGRTWQPGTLPVWGEIHFVNESVGWLVGGPTHSELYQTRDGGQSWQSGSVVATSSPVAYSLPAFEDEQTGIIAVTRYEVGQTNVAFYATADGGHTWQHRADHRLKQPLTLGTRPPVYLSSTRHWGLLNPAGVSLLPDTIATLEWATAAVGWLRGHDTLCQTTCRRQDRLLRTTDGGQTWTPVSLP